MGDSMDQELDEQLNILSRRFFDAHDALRRSYCPECRRAGGLRMERNGEHLRLMCYTPMPQRSCEDPDSCTYQCVFYSTSLDELPVPRFAKEKPMPILMRRTTKRVNR